MTRSVRILALITDGFGGHGGISRYNRDLLTALSQNDAVAEIVVAPRLGRSDQGELPPRVRQLPPVFNKVGYSLRAIRLAMTDGPFDVVFCGHILQVPLAAMVAQGMKAPLWVQLHGIDAWKCPKPVVRWGVEQARMVTVVSRYTKRKLLAWANVRPERVRVLPNTVSERFSPGPKSDRILDWYGLRGKRLLLTVSRLDAHDWEKGHHRVMGVLRELVERYPDLVYVIAGDGPGRGRFERMAQEHGVAERVKFIGKIDDRDLPDLYRTADVFVMPSTKEGFGIVFLEAMRSGIPVIGGSEDGSMDPLRDGTAGYAVPCDDREALIAAILSALERPRVSSSDADIFRFPAFSKHCAALLDHLLAASSC